jgi:hypothetical protein
MFLRCHDTDLQIEAGEVFGVIGPKQALDKS